MKETVHHYISLTFTKLRLFTLQFPATCFDLEGHLMTSTRDKTIQGFTRNTTVSIFMPCQLT